MPGWTRRLHREPIVVQSLIKIQMFCHYSQLSSTLLTISISCCWMTRAILCVVSVGVLLSTVKAAHSTLSRFFIAFYSNMNIRNQTCSTLFLIHSYYRYKVHRTSRRIIYTCSCRNREEWEERIARSHYLVLERCGKLLYVFFGKYILAGCGEQDKWPI